MLDLSSPKYDDSRQWIINARNKDKSWDWIFRVGDNDDEQRLFTFLQNQQINSFWEHLSTDDWRKLVSLQKEAEEQTKIIEYLSGQAMIMGPGEDNDIRVPKDPHSSWQLYKKGLLENGFKSEVVHLMEKSTMRLLKRLSNDTTEMQPVKGLVIGNVQSGKTANMAALMAMAADYGWNMFIVLSGTIENLRQQTQNRLLNDLNKPGNLIWRGLEKVSKKPTYGQRTQDLHFEETSKERYFTVCLKNQSRLKGLIQWLQSDSNKQKQMKILVIDDEADQAGINTADINSSTIRKINELIRNLVNGKNEKSQEIKTKYRAMNYIGYTATPYANILNEAGETSLYPRNFISTLSVSKEYFGPQQIFGLDGSEEGFEGLDIVRIIEESDLQQIKNIHDEGVKVIPESLKYAICWFMCGVASMRIWGYRKPISMLIHTSQKTDHHQNIANAVKIWLTNTNENDLITRCEKVWKDETDKFTYEKFREQYPQYDRKDEEINRYPEFSEVKKEIEVLLSQHVTNIPLDEDDELSYHKGIHMCVDNCKNNGINDDGMYVRLAYPTSENMPDFAPAFVIIGGATLSRGLTIEGLISTFFLRSVSQADTLMQMGRWFGYRKGYELIPRIWITSKTNNQFKFLASLDQELRDEIHEMDTLGKSPAQYGPRVKNTPKASFIRITAKNRMQSAQDTDMDFSGSFNQTYLFDNDKEILDNNLKVTSELIEKLGEPLHIADENPQAKNCAVWKNIEFPVIKDYLKEYRFNSRLGVFNDIDSVISWIEKISAEGKLENWNVVLAGKSSGEIYWSSPVGNIYKVNRTRKIQNSEADQVINIGVLSDPSDLVADVDLRKQSNEIKDKIINFKSRYKREIRSLAGLDSTPQLLIYIIDKNSEAPVDSKTREDLNAKADIVGICLTIPGGRRGTSYAATVSIHMNNNIFDDEGDLEETNED